jgi:hypothetical protein
MAKDNCVTKAKGSNPYRVDDRATYSQPLVPASASIFNGPTMTIVSGVRVTTYNGSGNTVHY